MAGGLRDGVEIWSGGQTGVDRAALDVALQLGLPYKGWVPCGRMAEDGPLDQRYEGLSETKATNPSVRTRRNVRDSDATLLIVFGEVSGGTAQARDVAERLGRALLVVDAERLGVAACSAAARDWLGSLPRPLRLNVGGPRASRTPHAYDRAREVLLRVFG